MLRIRPGVERGVARLDWLDSRHSFSFGHYYDPRHMGFRDLRVINDDRVAPQTGFGTHGHRDMEVVTYVLDGEIAHKDTLGNEGVIRAGEVQRMSAGTGVEHSELNPSADEIARFLQIWILPNAAGLTPGYDQIAVSAAEKRNRLCRIVSPDGGDGVLTINQDVSIYAGTLDAGATLTHDLSPDRHAWLQVAKGSLRLNDQPLSEGDGIAISETDSLTLIGETPSELLLFDLN